MSIRAIELGLCARLCQAGLRTRGMVTAIAALGSKHRKCAHADKTRVFEPLVWCGVVWCGEGGKERRGEVRREGGRLLTQIEK